MRLGRISTIGFIKNGTYFKAKMLLNYCFYLGIRTKCCSSFNEGIVKFLYILMGPINFRNHYAKQKILHTLWASPHITGRPKKTAFAPNAKALNTSVPLLTPPSTNTSAAPLTALAISGKTSSYKYNFENVNIIEFLIK